MGSTPSKESGSQANAKGAQGSRKDEVVCEDCKIETQKELPPTDESASQGGHCHKLYLKVDKCMRENRQQVTKCNEEWRAFRECHQQEKLRQ